MTKAYPGYPCPLIVDGRLVFSYDHNRREARFVEVDLSPISTEK